MMLRIGRFISCLVLLVLTLMAPLAQAQKKTKAKTGAVSANLNAEAVSAKAMLEDFLTRRYSQELATMINRQSFTLGAQLELTSVARVQTPATPPKVEEQEPLSDLMLGTLDPEDLLKRFAAATEARPMPQSFLDNYRIKSVEIYVGLNENVDSETKANVEKWLQARVRGEFGAAGRGKISVVKLPFEQKETKTLIDWLSQFQSLAGQLVLALAFLFGVILYQLFAKKSIDANVKGADAGKSSVVVNTAVEGGTAKKAEDTEHELRKQASLQSEIERLTAQLNQLVPRMTVHFENVVRTWCQAGDEGRLRLACFAEAVGREVGKLPIPVDALNDVTRTFSRMADVKPQDKKNALEHAYWDLMSVLNLGIESLSQPFAYMAGLKISTVNEILMDENPKLKTLVSLYMPDDLRNRYVRSLSLEEKTRILSAASEMSEIASDELRQLDGSLMSRVAPSHDKETVPLEMTLHKLVPALSALEEVTLLPQLKGPAVEDFRTSYPTLGFVDGWVDEALRVLLSRAAADELTAFLRVRPELQDRIMSLSPPMTVELLSEELARPDKMPEKEKLRLLESLGRRLREMVQAKEINLEDIFGVRQNGDGRETSSSNGSKSAA